MTEQQKAKCWDVLKLQLNGGMEILDNDILGAMQNMENFYAHEHHRGETKIKGAREVSRGNDRGGFIQDGGEIGG